MLFFQWPKCNCVHCLCSGFSPRLGAGLLCHRPAGPLRAASSWGVWRRYRTGQLPEVRGSSLLRRPPCRLLRRERQPDPHDARQNGRSNQVRHSATHDIEELKDLVSLKCLKKQMYILISGMQLVRRFTGSPCRPESSTFAEARQPATSALHRYKEASHFVHSYFRICVDLDFLFFNVLGNCVFLKTLKNPSLFVLPVTPRRCWPTWLLCLLCITVLRDSNTSPRGHTMLLWSWLKVHLWDI